MTAIEPWRLYAAYRGFGFAKRAAERLNRTDPLHEYEACDAYRDLWPTRFPAVVLVRDRPPKEHAAAPDEPSASRAEAVADARPDSSGSGSVSAVGGEGT